MTMSITEGLIRSLDPDFDLVAKGKSLTPLVHILPTHPHSHVHTHLVALPYFALYSNWTTHLTLGVQM